MSARPHPDEDPTSAALSAAIDDAARFPEFLAALAGEPVHVPVVEPPDGEGRVAFPTIRADGETFIAVYTSEAALARAGREAEPQIVLRGRELARMWPAGASMAINPGAGQDIALPGDLVRELDAEPGSVANRQIPAGTRVTASAPPVEPEALLARLADAAAGWPAVRSLHRVLVHFDDSEDPPQLLIGVEVAADSLDLDEPLAALARAAGTEAALMPLRRESQDPINRFMAREDRPFYEAPGTPTREPA